MQRFNVIMFFIAFLTIHQTNSFDISSLFASKKVKIQNESDFGQICYYELKTDLIIKNYVQKVQEQVKKAYSEHSTAGTTFTMTFSIFFKIFKSGDYGKIATEVSNSEDYVRSYWNYFKTDKSEIMTDKEFTKFMGLYYLEGNLLIKELHPTLSVFFPNEHEISKGFPCSVSMAFWVLTNELLQRIFIEFKWIPSDPVTKSEIFTIITNTHTGKCMITMNKKCPYFTTFIGNVMGFFNMSAGSRNELTLKEAKLAYSTFVFSDIYDKECKQVKFDAKELDKKIKEISFP